MITLIVKIDVKPGHQHEFIKETQVAQYKTLKEEGCKGYLINLNSNRNDPNEIILVEMYADEAAIEFHRATPHFNEWRDAVQPFMNTARQVTKLESINCAQL